MKIIGLILAIVIWVFVFWTIVISGGENPWRQHQTESYATTQGTVRWSKVTITHGSRSSVHYHVDIAYIYPLDGHDYYCGRYRYDGHPDNAGKVSAIVAAHPAGSSVPVYYDPQNPSDAVLSAGVDAEDVYMLFLTAPICLLFMWLPFNMGLNLNLGGSKVAGGVKIIEDMMVTRVRLPRFQPVLAALLALGGFSLAAGGAMAAGVVPGAPLAAGGLLLLIVIIGGAGAYGWLYRIVHSGRQDLVIDFGARTVQLPFTYKRRELVTATFSDIRQVVLQKVWHQRRGGSYYTYLVTLEMKDDTLQRLINLNEARAKSLAQWLNEKLGIKAIAPMMDEEG